jgi:hypothetical protein
LAGGAGAGRASGGLAWRGLERRLVKGGEQRPPAALPTLSFPSGPGLRVRDRSNGRLRAWSALLMLSETANSRSNANHREAMRSC